MIRYLQMDLQISFSNCYAKSCYFTSKSRSEGQNRESRSSTHLRARTLLKVPRPRQKRGHYPHQFSRWGDDNPRVPSRVQFVSPSCPLYSTFLTPKMPQEWKNLRKGYVFWHILKATRATKIPMKPNGKMASR